VEALYAPNSSRVVFKDANSGNTTYLRYWEALSNLAGWVSKADDGLEALYPPDCPERVVYGVDALDPVDCEDTTGGLAGGVFYFDGDSVLPDNPAANLVPGYDWTDLSGDASMTWSGTPNNSWSTYTGPSMIQAQSTVYFGNPDASVVPCSLPVYLSDPVTPQFGCWFTLLGIGDLTLPARADENDVLGKRARIGVSQVRGLDTGQLSLLTYTAEQRELAERMFATGRVLLYRNPDPAFPENGWYLHLGGDIPAARPIRDQRRPERIWTVPFTRVERPSGLIEAATSITWATRRTQTWGDLKTTTADWLEVATAIPATA
jgi:hypothetical protein